MRRFHFEPQVAIIGSSNINDRSLLGMRDSEVNVVIQEREPRAEIICHSALVPYEAVPTKQAE